MRKRVPAADPEEEPTTTTARANNNNDNNNNNNIATEEDESKRQEMNVPPPPSASAASAAKSGGIPDQASVDAMVAQAQAKAAELAAMAMRAGASGGGGGGGDAGGTTGGGGSAAGPNAAPLKVEFRKFDASQQTFVPPGETQNTSSNRFGTGPSDNVHEETRTVKLDCPQSLVGKIIGKGGETIKGLAATTGAIVVVDQMSMAEGEPRKIVITGTNSQVEKVSKMCEDIMNGPHGTVSAVQAAHPGAIVIKVECPKESVGRVIGRGGETIKGIQLATGARAQIDQTCTPCLVIISGDPQYVKVCQQVVVEIINGGSVAQFNDLARQQIMGGGMMMMGGGRRSVAATTTLVPATTVRHATGDDCAATTVLSTTTTTTATATAATAADSFA